MESCWWWGRAAGSLVAVAVAIPAAAETRCAPPSDEIVTDRPDVTNSSIVVPAGSLQIENGVNLTASGASRLLDGTNTRMRLGVAPCLELLADLPEAVVRLRGPAPGGVSNLTPAVKWQLGPLPGEIDLSATAGLGLPTGTRRLVGRGVQPYVQFPWSREIAGGWGTSGMFTTFFTPAQASKHREEGTLVLERAIGEHADLFVEYVGEFPDQGGPSHALNSGGSYRLTPRQQIDFHVQFGLNHNAPSYVLGIGYSFRFDRLF
jgi:Putative MetA-pathway of phenol degradation